MRTESYKTDIAVMGNDIANIKSNISEIKNDVKEMKGIYVVASVYQQDRIELEKKLLEFAKIEDVKTVKNIVFGFVTLILLAFAGAVINFFINK